MVDADGYKAPTINTSLGHLLPFSCFYKMIFPRFVSEELGEKANLDTSVIQVNMAA